MKMVYLCLLLQCMTKGIEGIFFNSIDFAFWSLWGILKLIFHCAECDVIFGYYTSILRLIATLREYSEGSGPQRPTNYPKKLNFQTFSLKFLTVIPIRISKNNNAVSHLFFFSNINIMKIDAVLIFLSICFLIISCFITFFLFSTFLLLPAD